VSGAAPQELPKVGLGRAEILAWLCEDDPARLDDLWQAADDTRRRFVGDAVHLRGLIEISNHCVRGCTYCGIRAPNRGVERYRMTEDEILVCARKARDFGYGTVVLQSGEDYGIETDWLARVVHSIKHETALAVTLSLGERPDEDLVAWRAAGADRYLLRFETSDAALYRRIHPDVPGRVSDRLAMLRRLQGLGFEAGTGVMVGIPGQSVGSLAHDIELFRSLNVDMIGIGPYLPHPATPLGRLAADAAAAGCARPPLDSAAQVPNTETMTCKVVALTRLACPDANIPATTALATVNMEDGRAHGLQRGANVVMPNLTPTEYREKYEIYPDKAASHETAEATQESLADLLAALGRSVASGPGSRSRSGG
jgi:biotin synthase